MRSSDQQASTRLLTTGWYARELLTSSAGVEVMAVVRHAAYLRTRQGEILWLSTQDTPMHRRCLQMQAPIPSLVVGAYLPVQEGALQLGEHLHLDFQNTDIWHPPRIRTHPKVTPREIKKILREVYQHLIEHHQAAGLSLLIPLIMERMERNPGRMVKGDYNGVPQPACQAVERILHCLQEGDFAGIYKEAHPLIGLGEGLTPSGDDFLGGLFFSLHVLASAFPATYDYDHEITSTFIKKHKGQTNAISYCLLHDHILGHSLQPLHELAHGLLENLPINQLLLYAESLIPVGHSTGWDLLSGFLAGMAVSPPN